MEDLLNDLLKDLLMKNLLKDLLKDLLMKDVLKDLLKDPSSGLAWISMDSH
jgi:hypothetical protein